MLHTNIGGGRLNLPQSSPGSWGLYPELIVQPVPRNLRSGDVANFSSLDGWLPMIYHSPPFSRLGLLVLSPGTLKERQKTWN
jgi:hypothetical protein